MQETNETGRESSHVKDISSQLRCDLEASLAPEVAHSSNSAREDGLQLFQQRAQ